MTPPQAVSEPGPSSSTQPPEDAAEEEKEEEKGLSESHGYQRSQAHLLLTAAVGFLQVWNTSSDH